jgi:hypothetical protein
MREKHQNLKNLGKKIIFLWQFSSKNLLLFAQKTADFTCLLKKTRQIWVGRYRPIIERRRRNALRSCNFVKPNKRRNRLRFCLNDTPPTYCRSPSCYSFLPNFYKPHTLNADAMSAKVKILKFARICTKTNCLTETINDKILNQ